MRELAHSTSRLSTRRTSTLEREDPQPFTIPSRETSLREMPLLHSRRVKVPGTEDVPLRSPLNPEPHLRMETRVTKTAAFLEKRT